MITGSFNFTNAAEYDNAENLLIIKGNNVLVERYNGLAADYKALLDYRLARVEIWRVTGGDIK